LRQFRSVKLNRTLSSRVADDVFVKLCKATPHIVKRELVFAFANKKSLRDRASHICETNFGQEDGEKVVGVETLESSIAFTTIWR